MLLQQLGGKLTIAITRQLNRCIACRGSQLLRSFAIAAVATVAPLRFVALVAQMLGQLSFEHSFNRLRKQSGEDTLLTEEVINGLRFAQLLLNLFEGRRVWFRSRACVFLLVFIGCLFSLLLGPQKFYFIRGNSFPHPNPL